MPGHDLETSTFRVTRENLATRLPSGSSYLFKKVMMDCWMLLTFTQQVISTSEIVDEGECDDVFKNIVFIVIKNHP